MTRSPDRMPAAELSVGSHLDPDVGVCLMEAVSRFAGLPWSDEPACTHPLVAHLARLANDVSSDAGRQQLVAFVPRLAAARGDDAGYARVAKACAEAAWGWHRSLLLAHLIRLADGQIRRDLTGREVGWTPAAVLAGRLYRRGPAYRTVEVAVAATRVLQGRERDRALVDLLEGALAGVAVAEQARVAAG